MRPKRGIISLRNLPPELERIIRQKARRDGLSLNKSVIRLLEQASGTKPDNRKAALHHDLDELAGCWSRQECRAFNESLRKQRSIDPELWR